MICVIDDDESLRVALVRLLQSLGYGASSFASAEEFLKSGAISGCSCVISDLQMPGMSGIDLTNLIAKHHSSVPVIMITARTEPDLEERALASGAACFLRKPIASKVLVDCLKRLLNA